MRVALVTGLALSLLTIGGFAQNGSQPGVVLGADKYLSAGAAALRQGRFDEAIRLTTHGLERSAIDPLDRAAGLANLCAAHVSKEEPDAAIPYCDESLRINDGNWRAYSVRARAYLLKGMYRQARIDNDAAAAISPDARHVRMIAGMLNEIMLEPRVTIEEHQ